MPGITLCYFYKLNYTQYIQKYYKEKRCPNMATMEEIDEYINEIHMKTMLDNYVLHNIPPDYEGFRKKEVEPIKKTRKIDIFIPSPQYDLPEDNTTILQREIPMEDLNKIREKILHVQDYITSMIDRKEDECPVCYEDMGNKSFLTGSCGHKYCGKCCYDNFTKNCHTGSLCPLCRVEVL